MQRTDRVLARADLSPLESPVVVRVELCDRLARACARENTRTRTYFTQACPGRYSKEHCAPRFDLVQPERWRTRTASSLRMLPEPGTSTPPARCVGLVSKKRLVFSNPPTTKPPFILQGNRKATPKSPPRSARWKFVRLSRLATTVKSEPDWHQPNARRAPAAQRLLDRHQKICDGHRPPLQKSDARS